MLRGELSSPQADQKLIDESYDFLRRKQDLRAVLRIALDMLDAHYAKRTAPTE